MTTMQRNTRPSEAQKFVPRAGYQPVPLVPEPDGSDLAASPVRKSRAKEAPTVPPSDTETWVAHPLSPIESAPSPLRPVAGIRDVALRAAEECEIGDTPVEKQDGLFKIFKKLSRP